MGLSWIGLRTPTTPSAAAAVPDHEAEAELTGRLMDELVTYGGCTRRDRYGRAGARRALALLRQGWWGRLRYWRWRAHPCRTGCGFWHLGPRRG